jgi:hypothetical protein
MITRNNNTKDLGVLIDFKLHFHHHVDYIFSQKIRLLERIGNVNFSFSSLQSLLLLYFHLVRPKSESASAVWNFIASTEASKLEHFVSLRHRRFFSHNHVIY